MRYARAVPSDEVDFPRLRVLRICSVFEPPDAALVGRGVRFDPVGGMQSHTGQLTRALAALGTRHDVVTHRPPGAARKERLGESVTIHRFGLPVPWGRQLYCATAAVAAWARSSQVDLVHAHVGEDLAVLPMALWASRSARVPLVVTVHCSLRYTFRGCGPRGLLLARVGGGIQTAICRRADAVISLTSRLAGRLAADGVPRERVHVIPSGVTAAAFAGRAPDPFPASGRPRVVYVGRLAAQKQAETLVEAAARMRTTGVQVIIVGDGVGRPAVEAAIQRHGVGDRVRITGFKPHRDIPAVLRHADVFCLPSRYEELGSALLEAMQAGLPIVASDTGGVREAVGTAARLVTPGDPGAFAHAIDGLLTQRDEAARLARLGRDRMRRFDWEQLAPQVLGVYRLAMAGPAEAPAPQGRRAQLGWPRARQ